MDFRLIPSNPMCLASCHILISKQDSTTRALRSTRCVTGRRSRDENHLVIFRQSSENRNRARDTQPTRGISNELARGCKRWHPLVPGRIYGKSSLLVYVSPPISSYLPNPSARAGYDTRSIFKRSLTGLSSEFSFSYTSCLIKAEEPSLPYYFTHSWRENNWIHTFPKGISAMWNAIGLVQVLNSCHRVHFLRR